MIDRKAFYAGVRHNPFPGKLTALQVKGMEVILDEWERRGLWDLRHLAYMLATAKWETDHEMFPNIEKGGNAYFLRMYDVRGERPQTAKRNGNTEPGDGAKYRGRGFVHLTWKNNYALMTRLLRAEGIKDADLVAHPELAEQPGIAAFVMFEGMYRGVFTGKKLGDYFNKSVNDPRNARRIINGTDRMDEIAGIYKHFYADLVAAA